MIILGCSGVSLAFGTEKILDGVTFSLQENDRAGLVGVNGAGKSTLFKIIAGILRPDDGEVYLAKGARTGYLEQDSGVNSSRTIWEEIISTFANLVEMEKRLRELEKAISAAKDQTGLPSLMKQYAVLSESFGNLGGYEYNSRARGVLKGLGFGEEQFGLKAQVLSGGQKTRLALAKLLLEEPDILLLDEPTNHLDIEALEWLEGYLKNYKKCLLVISHDRYFLDEVTSKTIELENRESSVYTGNYTVYMEKKAQNREIQQRHYENQQKEISRLEAYIEQQRRWNRERNIIAAESRQKALDRMEKVDRPKNLPGKIKVKFRSSVASGNDVLFVDNLSKEFPQKKLFSNISFKLKRNERAFLLGPNGCGKSTLLKILAGELDKTSGEFEYGHKVVLGYYDQEQENLDESKTVIDEVWDVNEKLTHTAIRNVLASFMFRGEDVFKPVSVLSGGEKSRVSLVKLMLSEANFLILDEPTNHLDIASREALENALAEFDGTILAVSHDRYFIKKLSSRILEMESGNIFDFPGTYAEYLDYRARTKAAASDGRDASPMSAAKLERLESKEERARVRKLEKQLSETEDEIGRIEVRLKEIESEMAREDVSSDHLKLGELYEEQGRLGARLEELYLLWEKLTSV